MISIKISQDDFSVNDEYDSLCQSAPKSGAVVFFVGLVRDLYEENSDDLIDYIELSHYKGMTESICHEIMHEAQQRFKIEAARLVHRVGKIYASEQIVMVAVASQHRKNAFQAGQFIMDYLKTRATLWKKEVGDRGEQWIGMKKTDAKAVNTWHDK